MEIRLRPELEALIRQDVQRGPYQTVDEFVERAIAMLHEQESWLAEHRAEIETQIAEDYAAAQRGELVEAEEVRSRLNQRKRTRLSEQSRE
jgi:Arc/MetJ-type ribon-helix-helix transcriptional regulator